MLRLVIAQQASSKRPAPNYDTSVQLSAGIMLNMSIHLLFLLQPITTATDQFKAHYICHAE